MPKDRALQRVTQLIKGRRVLVSLTAKSQSQQAGRGPLDTAVLLRDATIAQTLASVIQPKNRGRKERLRAKERLQARQDRLQADSQLTPMQRVVGYGDGLENRPRHVSVHSLVNHDTLSGKTHTPGFPGEGWGRATKKTKRHQVFDLT